MCPVYTHPADGHPSHRAHHGHPQPVCDPPTSLQVKKAQPRTAYTDRILDIVKSLRKQKAAIAKILGDIRESQKEVRCTQRRREPLWMRMAPPP